MKESAELLTPPAWTKWGWQAKIIYLVLLFGGMTILNLVVHRLVYGHWGLGLS